MRIHVEPGAEHAEVHEVDDLKRFSITAAADVSDDVIADALAPLAQFEPPAHAWVSIDSLRAACGRDGDAEWGQAFDSMVGYAASKGWVDESGQRLRAHLERGAAH